MQAIYLLLTIVGLIICFGGVFFRKPIAGITGFINGLFLGAIILVLMMLSYNDVGSELVVVLSIAFIIAGISVAFEKIFTALSALVSSLVVFVIIALILCEYDTISIGLIVAAICSVTLAIFSYIYNKYSFILVTAFTGGLAAAIGITFLSTGNTLDGFVGNILWGESAGVGIIIVITLILTVAGSFVQFNRLKKQEELKKKIELGEVVGNINSLLDNNLINEIKSYPLSFYVPVISFMLLGIINVIQQNTIEWYSWYSIIFWVEAIFYGASLACVTYAALKLSDKYSVIIQIAYAIGYILHNIYSLMWNILGTVVGILAMTIVWGIVRLIKENIRDESWKPLFALIASNIIYVFIVPAIDDGFYFSIKTILTIVMSVLMFGYVYKTYEKTNLFDFVTKEKTQNNQQKYVSNPWNSNSSGTNHHGEYITTLTLDDEKSDNLIIYCDNCGAEIKSDWKFCKNCGHVVEK